MIARLLGALIFALVLAGPALAQDQVTDKDYKSFDSVATQTEEMASKPEVTDERLGEMRAEMVKWRATFTAAQSVNADQITTLKSQIAALGPTPAEGQSEDTAIAQRRADLNAALAKLQAPVLTASEAATRADSIIGAVDKQIRERQADKLLRLSPSAANPVNWPVAVSMFRWMGQWIWDETRWRFTRPLNLEKLRDNAPLIVVLLTVSALLLLRGARWMQRFAAFVLRKTQARARTLISGFVSLGQIALPMVGAALLWIAMDSTALFGPIVLSLFSFLPGVVLIIFVARWLALRFFPPNPEQESLIGIAPEGRSEGRLQAVLLGVAVALYDLVESWIVPRAGDYLGGSGIMAADKAQQVAQMTDAAISVLLAPLQVFAAVALFRLGQILRRQGAKGTGTEEPPFSARLVNWTGTAAIAIAVVAPTLGVIGYVSAANALIWPAINTLLLFAMVVVLQSFVAELYVTLSRSTEARHDALLPVLGGFVLALAALPVLALIWGARVVDLLEVWSKFRTGVSVGGVQISPTSFLILAAVFGIGYALTRVLQGGLRSSILPRTSLDQGGRNAVVSGVGYAGVMLSALIAINAAGIDLSGLAIVAGALSVGIGFGLQNIVSNFVSGLILLIERPVSEGDWIEVGTTQGIVKAISVRATRIQTFDRSDVIVPNSDLISGRVTNWTRFNLTGRLVLQINVGIGADTAKVEQILREVAEAQPLAILKPAPQVALMGFGANLLNYEVRVILRDVNFSLNVRTEMNRAIVRRFIEEGIVVVPGTPEMVVHQGHGWSPAPAASVPPDTSPDPLPEAPAT
jgi:small-conductance mechanosensitive channel